MERDAVQARKDVAVDFLRLVVAGRIDEAYRAHVDMDGTHHNPYFAAGLPALKQAMIDNHAAYPDKTIDVKRVVAEGDLVAAHSLVSLNPGNLQIAAVHIFRFRGDRIVELWDITQQMSADSPNSDGMF
ncbi:MAG: nuclear transport factor 2 family protein [Acidobacteriota bacterium]